MLNLQVFKCSLLKMVKKFFHSSARAQYDYWFDIITPKYAEDALANYKWDLTKKGTELLKANGIPEQFAAIVGQDKRYTSSYYFAGDFNDIARVPNIYKIKGLPTIYKYAEKYADSSFYWSIYIPVMHKIFDSFEHKEVQDTVNHEKLNYNARIQGQSLKCEETANGNQSYLRVSISEWGNLVPFLEKQQLLKRNIIDGLNK